MQQLPQLDMILMDLDMPIMNGYVACHKIINYYSLERPQASETDLDELFQQNNWVQDLRKSYLMYMQIVNDQNVSDEDKNKSMTILFNLYQYVKFRALRNL